jgi:hypothetical protein
MKTDFSDKLATSSRDERVYMCGVRFMWFAAYYFIHWFEFSFAPFHVDFFADIEALFTGDLIEVIWIAFRESAKTTIAKIGVIYAICYEKTHYINWDSYDKDNSEAALFDIILELQTNKRLIADFGHLYTQQRSQDEVKRKRVTSFITSNNIKVEAFSTQESTRGRVFGPYRPGMYVIDDFETIKTRNSIARTKTVVGHIKELREGLSADGIVLYLANYISETGSVQFIRDNVKNLGVKGRERFINVENGTWDRPGKPTWPGKYCMTDDQAAVFSAKGEKRVSLQTKRRSLGKSSYEESMLNSPAALGQPIFDRRIVEEMLRDAREPSQVLADFRVWAKFDPSHRYALGADTSNGVGLDSNASVIIDFTKNPNVQIGAFDSNLMSPTVFAHEIKREADMFGSCLVCPEKNSESGGACLSELIHLSYKPIYQIRRDDKTKNILPHEYGWKTTGANKATMIFELKKAVEDGLLVINDERILKEMRSYSAADLGNDDTSDQIADTGTTRHFDLLMACAIAWQMRSMAKIQKSRSTYVQKEFETSFPIESVPTTPRSNDRDFGPQQNRKSYTQPGFESSAPDVDFGV